MAILPGMDASLIIDGLGGNAAVGRALGEKPSTVWRWRERGFPARHWHRIVELAAERKLAGVDMHAVSRPLGRGGPASRVEAA